MARPRTTRRYSHRFKATAVKLSRIKGVAIKDVAESLYIHPFMLSRWRKEANDGHLIVKGKDIDLDTKAAAELKQLRQVKKDFERLKIEHDLLKKAIEFTSDRKATSSRSATTTKKSSQ